MYSARDVKSIMSSLPTVLAQIAGGGNGGIHIDEMNVNANNPNDWLKQMDNLRKLGNLVPRRA
jgi:hypothetical protein